MISYKTVKQGNEWFETTITIGDKTITMSSDSSLRSLRKTLSVFDEEQIDNFLKWYLEKHIYKTTEEHFYADEFGLSAWGYPFHYLKVMRNGPYGPIDTLVANRVCDFPGAQNNDKLKRMLLAQIKADIHASLPITRFR